MHTEARYTYKYKVDFMYGSRIKVYTTLSPSATVLKTFGLVTLLHLKNYLRTPKEMSFVWVIAVDTDYIRN